MSRVNVHVRRLLTLLLVGVVAFGGMTAMPSSALADNKTDTSVCAEELGLTKPEPADAKAKTAVVLVHGLWSKGSTWEEGDPAFTVTLKKLKDVAVVTPFNYESANDRWVTEGDTAQRLAKTIVCLSRLYGGKKVVVVAHSMGGLLTRAALDWAAYGTFAKTVTGHIVTIGTPHTGAPLAAFGRDVLTSNCNQAFVWWGQEARDNCAALIGGYAPTGMATGSRELAALPKFPKNPFQISPNN
jgi:triacylglycerol esterase/lipase EstA (alpha/beta hydrolase family)